MKGLKRFTANMIMGANVASIILMLLVGYSDRLNPQEHPMLSCLGLTFPAFLLINVCFLVFWAVFSLKRVIVPLLGFLLCYGPVRTYFPLNLGTAEEANLKVISYNVAGYSADEAGVRGGGLQGALDYVAQQEDADIVCLQEITLKAKDKARFQDVFPYIESQYFRTTGSGVTLLSKYPITSSEPIKYGDDDFVSKVFMLDVNGKPLMVINAHLETAGLSSSERQDFHSMVRGDKKTEVAREESKRLLVKLGAHNVVRANQVRALARYIGQHTDVPVIFCGDFNDTPISYSRYVIGQHLTDCFRESGNGLGWSFWRDAIRVRIDHIFCSSQLTPVSCKVDDSIKSSDHYPMICGLKMDGNAQK